jgi:uncharacterized protein YegP (UPF0339 family)
MFEIYRDGAGHVRWRLRLAAGGRVLAESGDSYSKRSGAIADIKRVRTLASIESTQIVEVL